MSNWLKPELSNEPMELDTTFPNYEPMELDTTVLHGVTRPNSEPKPRRLKPELSYEPIREGPISVEDRKILMQHECYKGVDDYINQIKLSPYDATPPPQQLFGGNPVTPFPITESNRPNLTKFSQLALEYYNNQQGSGASFEFHDLVKFTFRSDARPKHLFTGDSRRKPSVYYITFQAKGYSNPAITNFQAKVLLDPDDKDKPPVVEECRIKI